MGIDTLLSESLYTLGFLLVVGVASVPAWLLLRSKLNMLEKKGKTAPLRMTILCTLLSIVTLLIVQPPKEFSVFAPVFYQCGVTLIWSACLILVVHVRKKRNSRFERTESRIMKTSVFALLLGFLSLFAQAEMTEEDIRYLPELRSAAWSPDLTKDEIRVLREVSYRNSRFAPPEKFATLQKYAQDKRNVELRYRYALALAERVQIPQSLALLKELSLEGYPYAMETFGEERVCALEKYEDHCDEEGYRYGVMKNAFLDWAQKDPLVPNMYHQARWHMPNFGFTDDYRNTFTPEGEKISNLAVEAGSVRGALEHYYAIAARDSWTDQQLADMKHYVQAAKNNMMASSLGYAWPVEDCFKDRADAIERGEVCLNDEELEQAFESAARYGNTISIETLILLSLKYNGDNSLVDARRDYGIRDFIRHGKSDRTPERLQAIYDKAAQLNNGRGWVQTRGSSTSIEHWEKLYNSEETRGFFDKVNPDFR
ncbi:hypothetical protein [Enterovibrio norvegicus]|uniref:hypothetical protein n=1 Tax=Enterovibrio norvegicus TaxID=188144 RepID=UPI0024B09D26|nr:hypothetical protein [Enterovibrio norvegicus]